MKKVVRIDALPESAWRYAGYDAIVCVDVLLSSTTIVTALAQGRRVFAAPTPAHAMWFQSRVQDAVVVTDAADHVDGEITYAGPASLAAAEGSARDVVHVSPFAEMLVAAMPRSVVHVACLRNIEATVAELAARHVRVAILGAGERGEVCDGGPDGGGLARRASAHPRLRARRPQHRQRGRALGQAGRRALIGWSRSAERLRARGRAADVDFVLRHFDDLDVVAAYVGGEVRNPAAARRRAFEEEDDLPTPAWGTALPLFGQ